MVERDLNTLFDGLIAGDARSVAKLISMVENDSPMVPEIYRFIHPLRGHAYVVGICGPPGTGKSTLINELIALLRERNLKVGVIAIDPTSPYSGGAILGDRVRMQRHANDERVMIRSMATRGQVGGLSRATMCAVGLLDASGKDVVIIETVGIGQDEVDIADAADTTVLVMMPGSGDLIQVLKAGIMEVSDIFVVNKADQGSAEKLVLEIQLMLELNKDYQDDQSWEPPVIKAEAINGKGIEELWGALEKHRSYMQANGSLEEKRKRILAKETLNILYDKIRERVLERLLGGESIDQLTDKIYGMKMDPYSAAFNILEKADFSR
jgi:LAO/AO transport system kinase